MEGLRVVSVSGVQNLSSDVVDVALIRETFHNRYPMIMSTTKVIRYLFAVSTVFQCYRYPCL
jgi:hypothetical protein